MTFDLVAFSYGAGLVMMPFIVGMSVSMIFNFIRNVGTR